MPAIFLNEIVRMRVVFLCLGLLLSALAATGSVAADAVGSKLRGGTSSSTSQQASKVEGATSCNPAWTTVPSPNVGNYSNVLYAVDGTSPTDLWAVGRGQQASQILHWDGEEWSVTHVVSNSLNHTLLDLAVLSPEDVWAVGWQYQPFYTHQAGYMERWDGETWSEIPAGSNNYLSAVDGSASGNVWAVGAAYIGHGSPQALFMHWDGSTWATYPFTATTGTFNPQYSVADVAVLSRTDAWAVGWTLTYPGEELKAIIYHWDGTNWTDTGIDPVGGNRSRMSNIMALAPDDIWATGTYGVEGGESRPVAIHWDGVSWTKVPFTMPGTPTRLTGIAGRASDDVWFTGVYSDTASGATEVARPILLHWNGSQFSSLQPAPEAATSDDATLEGITVTSSGEVWAVGAIGENTHTERYQPTFADVHFDAVFYDYIQGLACKEVISGFPDSTFRSGSPVTRGQMAKIVSNAAGYSDTPTSQTFADVLPGSPFYEHIERIASRGIAGGYECGTTGEPCDEENRPYFRPGDNISRGQLAKIASNAKGYSDAIPSDRQTFQDVSTDSTFWLYIERIAEHNVISGYACGAEGEPCPGTYYRPGSNVTRGQTTKIVDNAFFPADSDAQ